MVLEYHLSEVISLHFHNQGCQSSPLAGDTINPGIWRLRQQKAFWSYNSKALKCSSNSVQSLFMTMLVSVKRHALIPVFRVVTKLQKSGHSDWKMGKWQTRGGGGIHACFYKNNVIRTTSLGFRPTITAIPSTYGRISKRNYANRSWIVCGNF